MSASSQAPEAGDKNQGESESQGGTGPAKPDAAPRTGKDFGQEGTNKTIPVPKPDGAPSEELGHTPHIEKTPYTRG